MIFATTGLVQDSFYISGLSAYPIYLLDGPNPVLFDAGTSCAGKMYVEAIRSVLGKRQPTMLFLSHVHWDHCGSVSYLKDAFPSLKIASSFDSKEILKRPNAQALIKKLNGETRYIVSAYPEVDPSQLIDEDFRPFEVDVELKDGQLLELGDGAIIEVLATPGHTRDHLSYYLPQKKILIATESAGCLDSSGGFITEFLTDYELYMSSLQRLSELPVEVLCQGHRIAFVGKEEVKAFFARSKSEAILHKDRICRFLDEEGGSTDRVIQRVKAERYDTIKGIKQPELPYILNLTAQVNHLARKMVFQKSVD